MFTMPIWYSAATVNCMLKLVHETSLCSWHNTHTNVANSIAHELAEMRLASLARERETRQMN